MAADDVYFFAGHSVGYDTKLQQQRKLDTDAFVYRYDFGNPQENCLWKTDNTQNSVIDMFSIVDGEDALEEEKVTRPSQEIDLRRTSHFAAFTSPYAGSFRLMSAILSPRPCAFRSASISPISYYRGSNPFTQYLKGTPMDTSLLSDSAEVYFSDGGHADSLVTFDPKMMSLEVFTADEDMFGAHNMTIRECDALDRLIEVSFDVEVWSNTYPTPEFDIETSFNVGVGEVFLYKLPDLHDPEGTMSLRSTSMSGTAKKTSTHPS